MTDQRTPREIAKEIIDTNWDFDIFEYGARDIKARRRSFSKLQDHIVAALESERKRVREWKLALQSCTPQGSEFQTPEACVEYIGDFKKNSHKEKLENVDLRKRNRELEAENEGYHGIAYDLGQAEQKIATLTELLREATEWIEEGCGCHDPGGCDVHMDGSLLSRIRAEIGGKG